MGVTKSVETHRQEDLQFELHVNLADFENAPADYQRCRSQRSCDLDLARVALSPSPPRQSEAVFGDPG